jgi:hypothetical protein
MLTFPMFPQEYIVVLVFIYISEVDSISQWFLPQDCPTNTFKTKNKTYSIVESDLCAFIDESFELLPVIKHMRELSLVGKVRVQPKSG